MFCCCYYYYYYYYYYYGHYNPLCVLTRSKNFLQPSQPTII
jgi:hypothetical protein